MGFRVQGLGFRVWGLGVRSQVLGLWAWGLWPRVHGVVLGGFDGKGQKVGCRGFGE